MDVLTWCTKKSRIHEIVVMEGDFPAPELSLNLETGEVGRVRLYVPRAVAEDEKLLREVVEKAESFLARREEEAQMLAGATDKRRQSVCPW